MELLVIIFWKNGRARDHLNAWLVHKISVNNSNINCNAVLSYFEHMTFMKSQIQAWFKQVWIHSRSMDTHHKLNQSLVLSQILPMSAKLQHSESSASHTASAIAVFPLLIIFILLIDTEYEKEQRWLVQNSPNCPAIRMKNHQRFKDSQKLC